MTMPRRGVGIEEAPEKGATTANNLCHEGEFTNQSFEFGKRDGLPGKEIPKDVQNRSNPFQERPKLSWPQNPGPDPGTRLTGKTK
jgi:hypothetical protein